MKKMNKKKIMVIIIAIIGIMSMPSNVCALLQANKSGSRLTSSTADGFFVGIRDMENYMGKKAMEFEENSENFLDISENGIDVHMIKNTEWGAAALLAASDYGKVPTNTSRRNNAADSTTGNATGIYNMADDTVYEYTATTYAGTSSSLNKTIRKADDRYVDRYSSSTGKRGDATTELSGWSNRGYTHFVSSSYPVFMRGGYGFFGYSYYVSAEYSDCGSRVVVVCGVGL